MNHWLKRALATAALASGALIATAGVATAAPDGPLPVDLEAIISQTQQAINNNETNQNAESNAETLQVNVYAPISVLSKDSNNGDVEQSNEAETTAISANENGTEQSIDQDQTAKGGGSDGDSTQSQTAENNNTTDQNADSNAETNQSNVYAPIAVLSDGSNNGDVEQSNEAETTAISANKNGTEQSIDQDQTAKDGDVGWSWGCDKCGTEGDSSQAQTAENNNTTDQNAESNAETNQSNEIGSDQAKAPNQIDGHKKGYDDDHRDRGDVEQSNEAETTATSANENGTKQSIDQDQTAEDRDPVRRPFVELDDRDHKDKDDRDHKDKDDRDHKDKDDRDHKDCLGSNCDRCDSEGDNAQSQTARNNNTTDQNAASNARTNQVNTYAPVAERSHGSDKGDVEQTNKADTTAISANQNGAGQSIDQSQHLFR